MRALLSGPPPGSENACSALSRWLDTHPDLDTVAIYSPLPGEVDPAATIAAHPRLRWVYPKVHQDGITLTFHHTSQLLPGAFGILEPSENSPEVQPGEIDAFVCPGLAFDARGGRLGRGRGFYDRLLAKARPGTHIVGVCHPFQIVQDTFAEPHDIHMDAVFF